MNASVEMRISLCVILNVGKGHERQCLRQPKLILSLRSQGVMDKKPFIKLGSAVTPRRH